MATPSVDIPTPTLDMPNVIRVLSIDGGGIRGVIPARILVDLEERTGQRIGELFDVVAGTSSGGMIALALVRPDAPGAPALSAAEILDIYVKDGRAIFPEVSWRGLFRRRRRTDAHNLYQRFGAMILPRRFGNARYVATGLERLLAARFGDSKLADAVSDVVIPTYDWKAGRALVFRSTAAREGTGPNPAMRDVARATTAAPTYFPPMRLTLDDGREVVLIDGGVAANNPISAAYYEALRRETAEGRDLNVMVVSLGTGRPPEEIPTYEELWSRGWLSLGLGILGVVLDGTSEIADELMSSIIHKNEPRSRIWRFQTELRDCSLALDDASPANIQALLRLAEGIVDERSKDLEEIAGILVNGERLSSGPARSDLDPGLARPGSEPHATPVDSHGPGA